MIKLDVSDSVSGCVRDRTSLLSDSEQQDRKVLEEAAERFRQLEAGTLRQIAEELAGQDPYVYLRAISPGGRLVPN